MPRWTPDQSFYPSPSMAMAAPQEKLAYVATLNPQRGIVDMGGDPLADLSRAWRDRGVTLDVVGGSKSQPDLVTLAKIEVPKAQRKQGIGSQAMRELIEYGKTIALSPSTDFGATSKDRLRAFYKRFGFVDNRGGSKDFTISESMVRRPAGKP